MISGSTARGLANVFQGIHERLESPFLACDLKQVADDLEFKADCIFGSTCCPANVSIFRKIDAT